MIVYLKTNKSYPIFIIEGERSKKLQETHNPENNQSILPGPISKPDPYGSWESVSEKSSQ